MRNRVSLFLLAGVAILALGSLHPVFKNCASREIVPPRPPEVLGGKAATQPRPRR